MKPLKIVGWLVGCCLTLVVTACSPSLADFPFGEGTGTQIQRPSTALQIRYHSTGCFYLEYQGTGLLTDPFWTHLSFPRVLFGKLTPDPEQIEPHLPPLDRIKAVTIAHGHYDHLLDLPYIYDRLPEDVLILGSESVDCQMYPALYPDRITPVTKEMATETSPGEWIYVQDSSLRMLPIFASHGPHALGMKFYGQNYEKDAELPPVRDTDFQEGQVLAWLYDFLQPDGQTIAYRIFFMSSSTGYPDGYFPLEILNEKKVDVALLTVDCTEVKLKGKKGVIDFLKPEVVIVNHWENFFRKKKLPPKSLRVDLWEIEEKLNGKDGTSYIIPMWDRVYSFGP